MRLLLVVASVAALGGCRVVMTPGHIYVKPIHPVVVISAGHVHSDHCGHYYHRGSWHHYEGHRHARGCGHHYRGGRWCHAEDD